jgi:transcriptional regulator GlxA family with amidase domain
MKTLSLSILLGLLPLLGASLTAQTGTLRPREDGRRLRVAFVIAPGANVIDHAGPWEVFQDVVVGGRAAFELYTVSDDTRPLRATGGLQLVPDHTYAGAPEPDVVVIGAQGGRSAARTAWLQRQAQRADVVLSVCTGVSHLAQAGLLDGKTAATHHEFVGTLGRRYPRVTFVAGRRYVVSDARIVTAGGLTSGIDAALHIVERYFGRAVAQRTADYMEYAGEGWKED